MNTLSVTPGLPARGIGRWMAGIVLLMALALASGCATRPGGDPRDPFEGFNRGVTQFNDTADRIVLKPVASGYVAVVPPVVRTGVSNFFSNLSDVWVFINSVLQLKPQQSGDTIIRLAVNTTIGLGGILDVASDLGIEKYSTDLGVTLGTYGVGPGPYIVLPILGPSTLRDSVGVVVETVHSPINGINDTATRNSVLVLNVVDKRASLLQAGNLLDQVALDKYTFTRDAYLQRRRSLISPDKDDDGGGEDFSKPAAQPAKAASATK